MGTRFQVEKQLFRMSFRMKLMPQLDLSAGKRSDLKGIAISAVHILFPRFVAEYHLVSISNEALLYCAIPSNCAPLAFTPKVNPEDFCPLGSSTTENPSL